MRTVNLSDLSTVLFSKAKVESNYKRIQRFFKWLISVNKANYLLTEFVILVLNLKNRMNDLALDRTDWKFGKRHINILTLGVNIKGVAIPYKALKKYKKRWSIETLFGYFKTKGFNFEDTHMTDPDKVAAWMLLLTIAVTWVMKTRLMLKEKICVAAHGRPRKSVFRNGLDKLRRSLIHPLEEDWKEVCCYISFKGSKMPSGYGVSYAKKIVLYRVMNLSFGFYFLILRDFFCLSCAFLLGNRCSAMTFTKKHKLTS